MMGPWQQFNNWQEGVGRISQGVVILQEDATWLSCPWANFEMDFAKPWIEESTPRGATDRLLAVLLMLDARIDLRYRTAYRQQLWPAGIAKTLRLLSYHPRIGLGQGQQRWTDAWKTPLAIFTWLPKDWLVSQRPDLTFLLAPSVRFFLPSDLEEMLTCPTSESKSKWPCESTEGELERYFLADLATEPADRHRLGNEIGPIIVSQHLRLTRDMSGLRRTLPEALPGIFLQQLLGRRGPERGPSGYNEAESLQWLADSREELRNLLDQEKDRKVVVFDDEILDKGSGAPLWKAVWDRLLGAEKWVDALKGRAGQQLLKELEQPPISNQTRRYLQALCETAYLLVVDLRLLGPEKEPEGVGQLSGHRLLGEIGATFEAMGSPVPIIAFTSSQRQTYERLAYASGADLYVTKPTRFDLHGESLRLLGGLCVLMDPAFRMLGSLISKLSEARRNEADGTDEALVLDDLTAEMMLVRDTLANALEAERGARVPLKKSRDRLVRQSRETATLLGLIQEAYFEHSEEDNCYWRIIKHFRNLASHSTGVELLRDEGAPRLGLALIFLLYRLVLGKSCETPRGERVERASKDPGVRKNRLVVRPWLSVDSEWLRQVQVPPGGKPTYVDCAVATFQCLEFLSNLPPDTRLPSYFNASFEQLKRKCASAVSDEWMRYPGAHDAWKIECKRIVDTLSGVVQNGNRATLGLNT